MSVFVFEFSHGSRTGEYLYLHEDGSLSFFRYTRSGAPAFQRNAGFWTIQHTAFRCIFACCPGARTRNVLFINGGGPRCLA